MKKILLVLWLVLMMIISSLAQNYWRLTAGATVSYFVNTEKIRPKLGVYLGINREFHLVQELSFLTGINFSSRGTVLRNRTIAPYTTQPKEAFYWDVSGMIGYLEIPVILQYRIRLNKKLSIKPILGWSFTFPIFDLTSFKKKNFFEIYIPHQSDRTRYDYTFEQESVFGNNLAKKGLNLGFLLQYEKYALEIRFIKDDRDNFYFDSLSRVSKSMNSIYVLFSYQL